MGQFNDGADLLIEKLSHKADGKTEVVMLDELDRTTLDIIAKVMFEKQFLLPWRFVVFWASLENSVFQFGLFIFKKISGKEVKLNLR